jgi:hypothetical protein
MALGDLYFHPDFEFADGGSSPKLLIIICDCGEDDKPYLLIKTTSRKRGRTFQEGCIATEKLYYSPSTSGHFIDDTLVQLHEIYELSSLEMLNAKTNENMQHIKQLPHTLISKILNCLKQNRIDIRSELFDRLFPDDIGF